MNYVLHMSETTNSTAVWAISHSLYPTDSVAYQRGKVRAPGRRRWGRINTLDSTI